MFFFIEVDVNVSVKVYDIAYEWLFGLSISFFQIDINISDSVREDMKLNYVDGVLQRHFQLFLSWYYQTSSRDWSKESTRKGIHRTRLHQVSICHAAATMILDKLNFRFI